MRDLFVEDGPDAARAQHLSPDAAQEIRDAIAGRHVCPFCGAVREENDGACPRCSMDNTSGSRQATKARIGPWYVFQTRNPAAPGMKFETLLSFVRKGRVKARSVVRGPTTHQLWRFAAHVKGLSREFGICYSCGGSIDRAAGLCPHCNRSQEAPPDPDIFIEGQPPAATAQAPEAPVVRHISPTPLAAEDIVVPPLSAARQTPNRPSDPLSAQGKRDPAPAPPDDDETRAKRAEGFLSPQDLAAAFNLDFRPKGRQGRTQQQSTAIARRPASQKRPARWGRRIFLLLLLATLGAGAYAYRTIPEFRARTIEYSKQAAAYSKQAVEWGKQKWAQVDQPSPKTSRSTGPSINLAPAPSAPAATQPAGLRESQETSPAVKVEVSTPTPVPAKSPEPAATSKSDAWDQIYGKQPPQKTEAPKSDASVSTPPVTTAKPKATGTIDDVRALYRDAIDAEANDDFAAAVKKYEQIKQFSPDLWPADLNLRLTQARRQAR